MPAPPTDPHERARVLTELSGTVLEQRYELGRVLGAGGMGAVFEGRHLRLDRPVAIKVLRPGLAGHDEYVARFLREAKAASKIRHRNVVEILDYGETSGGLVYSVMELLVGQDLEQLLHAQPEGRLPWARACDLLVQIASGLKAAHGQGVIHRDIKPANCFLTDEDGEPVVKLVDFGIAKLDEADQVDQLTATTQVLGTPSYIAPELARTKSPASPRSDIYALGVLAYRMLTGRVPFTADTVFELLRRACFEPVPPLRAQVPDLPAAVEGLVLELLAKDPDERPADALTVRQRLLALSREPLGPRATEIGSPRVLTLDPKSSEPTAEERTTRPRDAIRGGTARAELPVLEAATVQLETEHEGVELESSRASEASTEVLLAPAGAPVQSIHDPPSLPSRSGATLPAIGGASPYMGDSASIRQPRRFVPRWGAVVGAAALVAIGGATMLVLVNGDTEAPLKGRVSALDGEEEAAELGAGVAVEVRSGPGDGSEPEIAASPRPGERADLPLASPAVQSVGDIEAPPSELSVAEAAVTGVDAGPSMQPFAVPEAEEPFEPQPKLPEPSSPVIRGKEQRERSSTSKPKVLPSDESRIAELRQRIMAECGEPLRGAHVTVTFTVKTTGEIRKLKAEPSGPAGECAVRQFKGMRFRQQSADEPKSIKVP